MRFFGLKSCDTCRKALKALADRDIEVIDVRSDGLTPDDIRDIVQAFGESAVNTRSTTWRGLDKSEQARDSTALLLAYPTLMKRPVIEIGGQWYQGWNAQTKQALGVE